MSKKGALCFCRDKELEFGVISGVEFGKNTWKRGSAGEVKKAHFQVPLAPSVLRGCVCARIPQLCGAGEWAASEI